MKKIRLFNLAFLFVCVLLVQTSSSSNGQILASGHDDHKIRLWEVETRQQKATLEGHRYWVNALAFSPDGHTLASGSMDSTVRLWDVDTKQPLATLTPEGRTEWIYSVAFSPDGKTLASGGAEDTVRMWE